MIKEEFLEKYISGSLNPALSPIPVPLVGGLVRGRILNIELITTPLNPLLAKEGMKGRSSIDYLP
ncbi:MAG TPA: hypothetical protein ACFYD6_13670 [Candidatus Brocadiia bacterium]|nr:hypothetical protein [Candidatus Brocadiales bacterium]